LADDAVAAIAAIDGELNADAIVVGVFERFVPVAVDVGRAAGGVGEPSRDGIDIDDMDDVDETGDSSGLLLVGIGGPPLLLLAVVAVAALVLGNSKFDIVGECFFEVAPLALGDWIAVTGEATSLELGDDVVDVLVHVDGILLATVEMAVAGLPFGSDAVVLLGC